MPTVGGKNASLGEMIQNLTTAGIHVPDGFATTVAAFQRHLSANQLDQRIIPALDGLDTNDTIKLASIGEQIRQWIIDAQLPDALIADVTTAWKTLGLDVSSWC